MLEESYDLFNIVTTIVRKVNFACNTVKLEMFADINVCEFFILKFAILGLPKVNFVFPQNNVPLLILLIGYIRWLVLFIHIYSLQVTC